MKAAIFRGGPPYWPKAPLKVEDVDPPAVPPGNVLVRVVACGLCHTDLLYLRGDLTPLKDPPIILGHEPSGVVEAVGEGVSGVREGDRVVVSYLIPCGDCVNCKAGRENICLNASIVGSSRDGALAEYLSVPEGCVFKLPDGVPLEESAIVADALATAYHAIVRRGKLSPNESVVIYGASGGVGLSAVQVSKLIGAEVIAVGRKEWKLEVARRLGASVIINAVHDARPDKSIIEITGGGADVAVDATGDSKVMSLACRSVRRGGRVIIVGYGTEDFLAPSKRVMWYELDVLGSCNYRPSDIPVLLRLIADSEIRVTELVTRKYSLDDINVAYDVLAKGDVIRALVKP
ncbi:MAG: alcohol dehydrogenase catalytic domain-containing protein [Nitrososphaerota archaeon]|nr:alcohol dehydrogenase catalytic domain-containing protein [Nitrososphaerota archaeon]